MNIEGNPIPGKKSVVTEKYYQIDLLKLDTDSPFPFQIDSLLPAEIDSLKNG